MMSARAWHSPIRWMLAKVKRMIIRRIPTKLALTRIHNTRWWAHQRFMQSLLMFLGTKILGRSNQSKKSFLFQFRWTRRILSGVQKIVCSLWLRLMMLTTVCRRVVLRVWVMIRLKDAMRWRAMILWLKQQERAWMMRRERRMMWGLVLRWHLKRH